MNDLDVKKIRKKIGVSQEVLAEMVGVHPRTVQNWEAGGVVPKSKHAILRDILKTQQMDSDQNDSITIPREVFDQITKLTETILSQQRTIETLTNEFKKDAAHDVSCADVG
jgi:DNA-binding XRE family transcriptional regulator